MAVQAWSGADWIVVVPEGVDDVTLHGPRREYRVQVKARHDPRGAFTAAELAKHIADSAADVPVEELTSGGTRIVMVLERPAEGIAPTGLQRPLASETAATESLQDLLLVAATARGLTAGALLAATHLLVIPDPADDIVDIVVARTGCIAAAGRLVAGTSEGESVASETARLALGEAMENGVRAPLIRIGLVERDVLAATADPDRAQGRPIRRAAAWLAARSMPIETRLSDRPADRGELRPLARSAPGIADPRRALSRRLPVDRQIAAYHISWASAGVSPGQAGFDPTFLDA